MSVFAFDSGLHDMVKITKIKTKYYVYRLKEVQEIPKRGHSFMWGDHTYKFIWERSAVACYNYKPYDDSDVASNPEVYIEDIKRWNPFKIRKMI